MNATTTTAAETANGTNRSSYQNAQSQRSDHDWVGSCSTTYRAYQPSVSRLPTSVDATTPTPSVALALTPTLRRRTRSHSSRGAATSSAFCLVRNASSEQRSQPDPASPGAHAHTHVHRRQQQREEQGVDPSGVRERAADAVGRGVEAGRDDPRDGAAAGSPHDEGQEHQDGEARRDGDDAHGGEVHPGDPGQNAGHPEVERRVGPRRVLRGRRAVERLSRRDASRPPRRCCPRSRSARRGSRSAGRRRRGRRRPRPGRHRRRRSSPRLVWPRARR